jgi:hypothetical protein
MPHFELWNKYFAVVTWNKLLTLLLEDTLVNFLRNLKKMLIYIKNYILDKFSQQLREPYKSFYGRFRPADPSL